MDFDDDIYTEEPMQIETRETGSTVEYTFTGPNMEVKKAMDEALERWGAGYNARVARIDILGPDQLRAVVTRWNSCD